MTNREHAKRMRLKLDAENRLINRLVTLEENYQNLERDFNMLAGLGTRELLAKIGEHYEMMGDRYVAIDDK